MSPQGKDYLAKLYEMLHQLPEEERLDAVREIESHIIDGTLSGQHEAAILARLGDPRTLAKAYRNEYMIEHHSGRSFKDVLAMISFYCTTGLLSVMVIPVLAVVAYGFGFCATLIVIAGIIRTFGVTWINMNLGPGLEVPTEWSMLYALPIGGIVGGIAFVSWRYLRKYMDFLSRKYQLALPKGR
ncbi:DUF1700 domain-containing protein [Paenibacillus sp. GCM10027626]|uniref:DUF1700 domain-containing protein n=1 Tax=Paenibacillus sp. GCM10027626 TaxID=3273411 RepID=UPI00364095E8